MRRSTVLSRQFCEDLVVRVDNATVNTVSPSKDGILEGANEALVVRSGAGQYDITLPRAYSRRNLGVVGIVPHASAIQGHAINITPSAVRVILENNAGTPTSASFTVNLRIFRQKTEV